MARSYTLDKSSITGWWHWECKDGSSHGSATSQSDAKAAASSACVAYVISPPIVDVCAIRGYLATFTVDNLDGKTITYSVGEIAEFEFSFFFGLPCANDHSIEDSRKAIVVLTLWGLYRGGVTSAQIKELHFLSDADFQKICRRRYFGGVITIDDNGTIIWDLP